MVNRGAVLNHDDEAGWVPAVCALGFVGTSFGVEDAARMNGRRHGDCYFAVGDLNFAANTHDCVCLGLLSGEVSELHQVAGQFRIADERGSGLLCDFNCVADMIAMSVSEEYVIDFGNG